MASKNSAKSFEVAKVVNDNLKMSFFAGQHEVAMQP